VSIAFETISHFVDDREKKEVSRMTITAQQMQEAMEAAGLRMTRPRQVLVEQIAAWARDGRDFTSETLWHTVQKQAPWVGRATVFRTIEMLTDLGFLDRISFIDGTEHYHTVVPGTHHHHLTCEHCHQVVSIDVCLSPELLDHVAQKTGFTVSSHRMELFGLCPHCQEEGSPAERPGQQSSKG
jgi:Fur family transcriptional regulator, ferric uptake regulator